LHTRHWRFLIALVLWASLTPARAAMAAVPDWTGIVGSYPRPGTRQAQDETAIMFWLQDTRTRADIARVQVENHPDLGCFLGAVGSSWGASAYPGTKALLKQAKEDMKPVVAALKASFARPRPHVTDPALVPVLPDDGSFSFPSRHATEGVLFAAILVQLDPYDQVALAEEGKLIGDDRTMAGMHWPSDVEAGQRLGQAFALYWLALPGNAELFQAAAAEWNPYRTRAPGPGGEPLALRGDYFSMGTMSSADGMSVPIWLSAASLVRCRLSSR
jgi:membrane-associated phospholipid phosphatase